MSPRIAPSDRSRPRSGIAVGRIFACVDCGAELMVLRYGTGELAPRCCNRNMILVPRRAPTFVCRRCGVEVSLVRSSNGDLELVCCGEPMCPKGAAA